MATKALVSIEEYLNTSYRPDVEYVDGELREKPGGEFSHGEMQGTLSAWFWSHRQEWSIKVAIGTQTRTSATHVRLADVVVVSKQERSKGALNDPPLIAIEVLSPSDTYTDLKARAEDLTSMGVRNVWLIDPDKHTGEVWTARSWAMVDSTILQAVDSPMFVDLAWLWTELDD